VLPADFDALHLKYPDHSREWEVLRDWFTTNASKKFVEPMMIHRMLGKVVRDLDFDGSLLLMATDGLIKPVLRVKSPDGVLLEGDWQDGEKIPRRLPDRSCTHTFDVREECEVVAGYAFKISGEK
jgi:hypothetical protein